VWTRYESAKRLSPGGAPGTVVRADRVMALFPRQVQRAANSGISRAMDDSGNNEDPRWTRQPTEDIRAALRAEAVATASNATALRRQLHDWLARDLPTNIVDDLVLAVYEAIANAAEHAYVDRTDGPGLVRLEAHRTADHILITVADQGHWRAPTGTGFRGRGIPLMRLLTQNVHTRCDHRGTVVHLRAELPPTCLLPPATEAR
jgi:serine/threonine-protein kinase RsbW